MKKISHPYYKWEDWQNGLFIPETFTTKLIEKIKLSKDLLTNCEEFRITMKKMIKEWRFASEENLSDTNINRQAWLGQAACCYKHKNPEHITRYAWREMTEEEQTMANLEADKIIKEFEKKYEIDQNQYSIFEELENA